MIISRTPVRFSFLGGGTDYPAYYRREKGVVVGTTLNKYSYLAVYPLTDLFDCKIKVKYSKIERVKKIEEIQHPSVRECLNFMNIDSNIEIHYFADLPAGTGLGSSSSFTVGLLNALHAFKGQRVSKKKLAEDAIHVEQDLINERVGSQDQYHAAFGGLNVIYFSKKGIKVEPLMMSPQMEKALEENTLMFFTGVRRRAHQILEEQLDKTKTKKNDRDLKELYDLALRGVEVLEKEESIEKFGEIMNQGWELKKKLSSAVSTPFINQCYEKARNAGALGGKLAGAGTGGFLFFVVPKPKQDQVRKALAELQEVKFKFEKTGSRIQYYYPDTDRR